MGNEVSAQVSPEDTKRRVVIQARDSAVEVPTHRFTWYYPNWEPQLDENGQTYYQNAISLETRWDPRELEDIEEGEMQDYYQADEQWDSHHADGYDDPPDRQNSMMRTASSMALVQKQRAVQMEERKEKVKTNPVAPWEDLSQKAKINMDTLQEHVAEAQAIVKEVAAGKCTPELLYQLPWAYKVQQLNEAVQDCYVNMGDIYDSSKYDNCNGVPRYEDGGLVAWWEDLEEMHFEVTSVIESGLVGQESEKYMEEMKKLQGIAAMGNEDELIEGFLARKIEVNKELDDLRARCLAAVCVEGGPKRESLDQLYMYLKDNVNADTNLEDVQDEMEEVVSTALEQKHRFMVDVVLFMGILEDEHVRLENRINNFTGERWRGSGGNRQDSAEDDVEDEDDDEEEEEEMEEDMGEVDNQGIVRKVEATGPDGQAVQDSATVEAGATEAVESLREKQELEILSCMTEEEKEAYEKMSADDKATLRAKIAEQAEESKRLADELQHQKDQRSKALKERLAKKKQSRVAELQQEEGISEEEALAKAEEEVSNEESAELTKIDEEIAEEIKKDRSNKVAEAISLFNDKSKDKEILQAKMAEQAEKSKRLADELQHQKDKRSKALQDRLAKKKVSRVEELQKEGLTEDEAAMKAELETADEEAQEASKIDEEAVQEKIQADQEKAKKMEDFCDEEAKRIAQEVEDERVAKLAELQSNLEAERRKLEESGLSKEEVEEAIENKQAILEDHLEKELAAKAEKRRLAVLQNIRDEHLKSSEALKTELSSQKEQKLKAMKERLNKKKQARTAELMKEGRDVDEAVAMANYEIDGAIETETKLIEKEFHAKQREAEERALKAIKESQEKEAARLEQDMLHREARQKKSLQERLKKREKAREEKLQSEGISEEEAHKIAEKEKLEEEAKQTELLEKEIAEIKRTQEVEAQKLNDVKAAKQESTKKALQERLAKKKAKKQQEITPQQRTENFLKGIRAEQKDLLNKLQLFVDSEKKKAIAKAEETHDSDAFHVSMLFATIKESMITGYKKQCVYQVRALKDKLATEALSKEEHANAMVLAADNLLSRHNKDMKSVIDTQLTEQQKAKAKLAEDGAPMTKILEAEEKFHKKNVDLVRKQNTKLFFTLAGIFLDMSYLVENHHDESEDHEVVEEDDEEDIFGDKETKHVFSNEAQAWFQGAMGLQNAYDKVPVAMLTTFQEILLDIQSGASSIPKAESGLAGLVFYNLTLVLLQIVGTSFQKSVEDFNRVNNFTNIEQAEVSNQLNSVVTVQTESLESVYIVKDKQVGFAMQQPFRHALQGFLAAPLTERSDFFKKIESIKEETAKAAEKSQKSSQAVIENIDRSNRILKTLEGKVDKRKREIVEKYRKIKEAKERECKDAGTDMPENFIAGQDLACEEEVSKLKMAFNDIRDEVAENTDKLQMVNADGLMFAVQKKIKGEAVEAKNFRALQEEVEKENERLEAKRLLQAQQDEAEKLDVRLKVQKAREQQALQKRLLERKKKKKAAQ